MSKTSQITQLPLEAVPDAIVVVDGEGQIIQINTQSEKLFGYSPEELLGHFVEILMPERFRRQHVRHRTGFFTHPSARPIGMGLDLWGLSKDGREFPVEISLSPFEVEGELLVTAAIRDITERKRAEETIQILLRLSEKLNSMRDTDKLLDTLIQETIDLIHAESGCAGLRTPKGMVSHRYFQQHEIRPLDYCWPPGHGLPGWVLSRKTSYLTNDVRSDPQIVPQWRARFEVKSALSTPILDTHGEVIGFFEVHNKKDPSGFTPADQELLMAVSHSAAIALQNALAYEQIQRTEAALKRANDELERQVQERTTTLVKINEALQAEIAEHKQAEERLRQQQAELAHMGRFVLAGEMASGLAHELNQPLGAIKTYTEACLLLIGLGKFKSETLVETMEKVAIQAQRAGEIIQRLRNLVRKVEPRRSAINVNELIQEVIILVEPEARQQEIQIQLELDDTLLSPFADGIQIQQVVLNLVRNAIEAMGESQTDEPRVLTLRTAQAGSDVLEATVSDTGPDLSSEERERLFMPFFTTKPTGMGLGLSISQSIIKAHKGNLWATANADRGITLHFTLPYELRESPR